MEHFLYWLTTHGIQAFLGVIFFLSKKASVENSLGVGLCVYFSFCVLEFCLVWSCAGLMCSMTVHKYIGPATSGMELFPWNHQPLFPLTIFLPLTQHKSLSLEGKGLVKHLFYSLVLQSLSLLIHCQVQVSVNCHLLQEEVSLIKVKRSASTVICHFIDMFS